MSEVSSSTVTVVFLGSGVSKPSGVKTISELTDSILRGSWHHKTEQIFFEHFAPGPPSGTAVCPTARAAQHFLLTLRDYLSNYRERRPTGNRVTYEDLAALCRRIDQVIHGAVDDPVHSDFVSKVENETRWIQDVLPKRPFDSRFHRVERLADLSITLINSALLAELTSTHEPVGLQLLTELAVRPDAETLVFTLNHDDLIERYFNERFVTYSDGFGKKDGDVRWYDPVSGWNKPVKLVKLHGSVNWFEYSRNPGTDDRCFAIPNGDPRTCSDDKGLAHALSVTPEVLLDADNKERAYYWHVYEDLHHMLACALPRTDRIIMSGFGWMDYGISVRFLNWMQRDSSRHIILFHQDTDDLRTSLGLGGKYDSLVEGDQLRPQGKWFREASIDDLPNS